MKDIQGSRKFGTKFACPFRVFCATVFGCLRHSVNKRNVSLFRMWQRFRIIYIFSFWILPFLFSSLSSSSVFYNICSRLSFDTRCYFLEEETFSAAFTFLTHARVFSFFVVLPFFLGFFHLRPWRFLQLVDRAFRAREAAWAAAVGAFVWWVDFEKLSSFVSFGADFSSIGSQL